MQGDVERKEIVSFEFSILKTPPTDMTEMSRLAPLMKFWSMSANLVDVRTSAEWTFVGIPMCPQFIRKQSSSAGKCF